jgi:hypothetical protein
LPRFGLKLLTYADAKGLGSLPGLSMYAFFCEQTQSLLIVSFCSHIFFAKEKTQKNNPNIKPMST